MKLKIVEKTADAILNEMMEKHPHLPAVLTRVAGRVEINKRAISQYQAAVLFHLVSELKPKRILEIGTALGYSASIMAEAAPQAQIISLNPMMSEVEKARNSLVYYPNVEVISKRSWDYLARYYGPDFDFIFVDGDHKNVRRDLPWWDHLAPGGVIFFHDYSPAGTYRECPPVFDAVNEFAIMLGSEHPDLLVVDDGGVGMAGFVKTDDVSDATRMQLVKSSIHSHCTLEYLVAIYNLGQTVKRRTGAIVECGVSNGGSAAVLALAASRNNRDVWLFDTFEGMPEPDRRFDSAKVWRKWQEGGWCAAFEHKPTFATGFVEMMEPKAKVHVAPGMFADTFAQFDGKVLILHVDATLYRSTKEALEYFYPMVVDGGLLIVGAYKHWPGVRKAVDGFRKAENIKSAMLTIDRTGIAWRKS